MSHILGIPSDLFFLFCWVVVGACIVGVWYEIDHDAIVDNPAVFGVSVLWPIVLIVAACFGILWVLSWIPRGPTRLVLWFLNRRRKASLPEMRVL